jgi:propanol-preferring alcohol dehydrogenase
LYYHKAVKAVRFYSPKDIQSKPLVVEELPVPQPGLGQVRIKVSMCGVCHTDLHIAEGEIHPPHLPITPGHQVVGVVDALGDLQAGTQTFKVGQKVGVPWLHATCGECKFCLRGEENLCASTQFTGFHVDGGFAEYLLADARFVLPLPKELSDEQAAPLLCAGIVGYRSLRKADAHPGEKVGLFGFGASAHLCIQVLRYWGCPVYVFTRSNAHQAHALELGAVWAGEAGSRVVRDLDRAVIFAPAGELVPLALEKIRPGGTVAINAIHMSDFPSFPYQTIYGERTLRSVANATYRDGVEFLDLAVKAGIQSTVNTYPLEDANQALIDLKSSKFNGEAVLVVGVR